MSPRVLWPNLSVSCAVNTALMSTSSLPRPGDVKARAQENNFERHTTRENIRMFFDPNRYRTQKRPADTPAAPPARPAKLSKSELLDKFKLAASMNGFALEDVMAASLCVAPFFL